MVKSARASNARLVNEYLEYAKREQGRAVDTLYGYGLQLGQFVDWLDDRCVLDVEADVLRVWVHRPHKFTGKPVSAQTVKVRTCLLRSLYAYLHDVKHVARWNTAKELHIPVIHNEEPKPAPEAAWMQLWDSELSLSDRVAFGLGFFCGLRRHEVTLLRPLNFVEVPKQRIGNFKRKGGKVMSLPYVSCARFYAQRRPELIGGSADTFLEPLAELLRIQRTADAPRVLTWRELQRPTPRYQRHDMPDDLINPNHFNVHLREALAALGLDELTFSPHQLRHSFGTNMLGMGMPLLEVSRLMGHSSLTVTQRYLATLEDPFELLLDVEDAEPVQVASPWK